MPRQQPEVKRRRRRVDAQRNWSRILDAARDAFIEEGVGVSLDEIARRAGVGPGTVYRHFPTKKELLGAVMSERLRELTAEAEQLADNGDPATALFTFLSVSALLEYWTKMPLIISDVFAEVGDDAHATIKDAWDNFEAAIGVLLGQAHKAGVVRDEVSTRDLIALMRGVYFAAHQDSELLGRTWSIVLRGVQPTTTRPPSRRSTARHATRPTQRR